MGLKSSSHNIVSFMILADDFVREGLIDIKNTLYQNKLVLNLLGDTAFDLSMPFIYKLNSEINIIANNRVTCINSLRVVSYSVKAAWLTGQRYSSYQIYLGMQEDICMKILLYYNSNSAWISKIFIALYTRVFLSVTLGKQGKGKSVMD